MNADEIRSAELERDRLLRVNRQEEFRIHPSGNPGLKTVTDLAEENKLLKAQVKHWRVLASSYLQAIHDISGHSGGIHGCSAPICAENIQLF